MMNSAYIFSYKAHALVKLLQKAYLHYKSIYCQLLHNQHSQLGKASHTSKRARINSTGMLAHACLMIT